jgi:hypothetical protein
VRWVSAITSLSLLAHLVGCTLIDTPEAPGMVGPGIAPTPAAPGVDTNAVLAALSEGAYRTSPEFMKATKMAYASNAVEGSWVQEWVSSNAYATYSEIRPEASGSGVVLPAGTTIIRSVSDAQGQPTELTVMVKGPSGYNPDLGDWWFGVTDPTGAPLATDAGVMMGRLSGCYVCHQPRSSDDFLFGVPTDDRP